MNNHEREMWVQQTREFYHKEYGNHIPAKFIAIPNEPTGTRERNAIDINLQKLLFPLNFAQYVTFIPMYSIRRAVIYPNGILAYCFVFIGFCLFTSITIYRNAIMKYTPNMSYILTLSLATDLFTYFINYILSFICNIIRSKSNVEFVLRLQCLQDTLRCEEKDLLRFTRDNWLHLVAITVLYVGVVGLLDAIVLRHSAFDTTFLMLLFAFDMNEVYATRMLALLRQYLELWIRRVSENDRNIPNFAPLDSNMFKAYLDILDAYDINTGLFKNIVTYYVSETFFRALLYVQIAIFICKVISLTGHLEERLTVVFSIFTWTIKNMIIMMVHNVECERFYLAVDEACAVCEGLQASPRRTREEKRLYKNVCRVTRATFSRQRGWGFIAVEAALTLRFIDLATTYIVVLLQFAFI